MKKTVIIVLFMAGLAAASAVRAQMPEADALGLIEAATPASADTLPRIGTYFSARNPNLPPFPCNMGYDAWDLGGGIYLLDDLDSGLGGGGGFHALDDPLPPGFGDGGGGDTNDDYPQFTNTYVFPTNSLWLEMTNVSGGLAYANLRNATDFVYEIFSKAGLLAPGWDIAAEVFPSDTNSTPFFVPQSGRTNLFIWARDWTGVTSLGNTTPEWWLYYYFGTVDLADSDLDSTGANTLLYDYTNSLDPNVIQFVLLAAADHVNTRYPALQSDVTAGVPSYYAVFANEGTATNWFDYASSSLTAILGTTDGVYTVHAGLRGLPPDATQTWNTYRLTLDTVAPVVVITNPAAVCTVSAPMIQLQGFANEDLSGLAYDVSNAAGVFTNQTGYVTGNFWDTNLSKFTTNYFQCYDVRLTNGLNQIAVHVFDLAGNETTASVSVTLDYSGDTTPPALAVLWPQDGTKISGGSFTLQARMDDYTAAVTASIVGTNGVTNTVAGVVERNGSVWADSLPMGGGTNILTLTARDAAGNATVTNLTVVGNDVGLTMDPLNGYQLNQSLVDVSGTVGDASYSVTVNGVAAAVGGDPAWEADGVPVSASGTAGFYIEVRDGLGNLLAAQTFAQEQAAKVGVMSYSYHRATSGGALTSHWTYLAGGFDYIDGSLPAGEDAYDGWAWENYSVSGGTTTESAQTRVMVDPPGRAVPGGTALYMVRAQVAFDAYRTMGNYDDNWVVPPAEVSIGGGTLADDGQGDGYGETLVSAPAGAPVEVTPQSQVQNVMFGNFSQSPGGMTAQQVELQITDANGTDLTLQTNTVIAGQQMNLQCQLNVYTPTNWAFTNFQWTVPGFTISNFVANGGSGVVYTNFALTSSNVNFYWVDGSTNLADATNRVVQCSATVNGKTITGQAVFKVLKPMATVTTSNGTIALDGNFPIYNLDGSLATTVFALHYGDTNTPGISFFRTISIPTGFSGTNQWVQMINSQVREVQVTNSTWYLKQVTNVLDTYYPYPGIASTVNDTPGQGIDGPLPLKGVSASDNFSMWLMFKPTGGQWVPLKIVNWNWSGGGSLSGTNWILTSSSAPTPTISDSITYPQWTNNILSYTNFIAQP